MNRTDKEREKEKQLEEKDKEDERSWKRTIFQRCGNEHHKEWIINLLKDQLKDEMKNFSFSGQWDDNFAGGKILYLLGKAVEEAAYKSENKSEDKPEHHLVDTLMDLTEDEYFLEFRQSLQRLGIPQELQFDDEDWDDVAIGDKLMVTLEALRLKLLGIDHQEVSDIPRINDEKDELTPKPQNHPLLKEAQRILHNEISFGEFFRKLMVETTKHTLPQYDPTTTSLVVQQNKLINTWRLFLIVKDESKNLAYFDSVLDDLASKSTKEKWESFKQIPNLKIDKYDDSPDDRRRALVCAGGVFNESALHLAVLFNKFDIVTKYATKYPELIERGYEKDLYHGETLLHMLIAKGRDPEIEYLLHLIKRNPRYKGALEARCDGKFFSPSRNRVYLGEHPLSFAINIPNLEIAKKVTKLLIRAGASRGCRDQYGNNLLHNMVFNNNPRMFEFFFANWPSRCETLQAQTNSGKLTPLQYAASLGHEQMVHTILKTKRVFLWKFLNSANYAYPLEEIDSLIPSLGFETNTLTPENQNQNQNQSQNLNQSITETFELKQTVTSQKSLDPLRALEEVSIKYSALELLVYTPNLSVQKRNMRAKILETPYLYQLVFDKWNSFGAVLFYLWLSLYMVFLIVLTVFALWGSTGYLSNRTYWGLLGFIFTIAVVSLLIETFDIIRMRKYFIFQSTFFYHTIAIFYSVCIIIYFIIRLVKGTETNCYLPDVYTEAVALNLTQTEVIQTLDELSWVCVASNALMSLATFFAWLFLLFFTIGFRQLGLFTISLREIFVRDLLPFVIIFFVFAMAFSLPFYLLWGSDVNFSQFGSVLFTIMQIALYSINFGISDINDSNPIPFVVIIFVLSIFILGVLLTNMLIAAMSATYAEIQESASYQLFFEFVSTILMIERRAKFLFRIFPPKILTKGIIIPAKAKRGKKYSQGQHFRVEEIEEDIEEDDD